MRPTTANTNVFHFNALLHPDTVFDHPKDVVRHTGLTVAEKRAILASWASHPRFMGVGCIRDSVLPVDALSCRTEKARVDRRNPGGPVRTGRGAS